MNYRTFLYWIGINYKKRLRTDLKICNPYINKGVRTVRSFLLQSKVYSTKFFFFSRPWNVTYFETLQYRKLMDLIKLKKLEIRK